jgi:ADP-ribosylglycohydrolase
MTAIHGGANFGRDADTIAGMAGLLSGALSGIEAIDPEMFVKVCEVNGFDLEDYAARLATVSA